MYGKFKPTKATYSKIQLEVEQKKDNYKQKETLKKQSLREKPLKTINKWGRNQQRQPTLKVSEDQKQKKGAKRSKSENDQTKETKQHLLNSEGKNHNISWSTNNQQLKNRIQGPPVLIYEENMQLKVLSKQGFTMAFHQTHNLHEIIPYKDLLSSYIYTQEKLSWLLGYDTYIESG